MRNVRTTTAVVGLIVLVGVAASCVAPTPTGARRVSPNDGTGYVDPIISGDGDTVLYRREADRGAGYDAALDLVVSTVSTGATRTVPGVRTVHAVSQDGSRVVHGIGETKLTDTVTGASWVLRSGPTTTFGDATVSADAGTVAWTEVRYDDGFCPCELHLVVWRDGAQVLDQMIEAASSTVGDEYRPSFVSLDATGGSAFLHRYATREVVRVDTTTGALSTVPLQLPPVTDISPYPDLAAFLRWSEWIDVGSSDGTTFRLVQDDEAFLVRTAQPPLDLPMHGISDPRPSLSPNGRYVAYVHRTPTLPGQVRRSYRVRDLVTGQIREVVASDAAEDDRFDPRSTFNGWGSVADTGRATFGQWAAPLSGPWPPSVIYVDR